MGNIFGAIGDIAERDLGHALNAGQNLVTNGTLHAAPGTTTKNIGTGLIMNARADANNPATLFDVAQNGYNAQPGTGAAGGYAPVSTIPDYSSGSASGSSAGSSYGSGGTGGNSIYATPAAANGTGAGNQADIAAYQDQINQYNQLLQSADASAQSGQDSINRNYQNGYNQLQDQNNLALQNFNQAQNKADAGYQTNLQGINTNSRNSFNSLQRLLAGSGSAAELLAPYLVAQQANQQKSGASTNYADNVQGIATAKKNTDNQYHHSLDSLLGQKNDKVSSLLNSIAQQKMQYQQGLGAAQNQLNIAKGGNYQTPTASNNAIAALIAQQQGLSSQYADPTYQIDNISTSAPDVTQFQQQAAQLGNGSNQAPSSAQGQDPTSSALAALLKQNTDKTNTNAYAY